MPTWSILARELLTTARRRATYRRRSILAIGMLLAMENLYIMVYVPKPKPIAVGQMAWFGAYVFGQAALVQFLLTIWLVPACVAGVIAEEKQRRSLTPLLTTWLTSAEIVVGKLTAGLVQYASCLATGLPILSLIPLLGGVDPVWVLVTYAATGSTAYFLAGMSIVVSTAARRPERAVGMAIGLASMWCALPVLVREIVRTTLPRLWPSIHAANDWVLASSPTSVLLVVMGAAPGWRLDETIGRMIGLQLCAGSLLIAWAVARFRGTCRVQEGSDAGATGPGWCRPWTVRRFRARPTCGADPVLWKELHTAAPRGAAGVVGLLAVLGLVGLIGYHTYQFARPAFQEWFANGYGGATSEVKRTDFNRFLGHLTTWVESFMLLIVAGVAAGGVSAERTRETWDSLVMTPLSGRTILRAKRIGAIWRVRWGVVLVVALWSIGLLAGSLHPIGFAAGLVLLVVSLRFMAALGTYASLVSRDTPQASNRTLIPALVLMVSCLACFFPPRIATVLMGSASPPFVNWLALVSYGDVDEFVMGREAFGRLEEVGVTTYEGPWRVLAGCLVAMVGFATAASWLVRAAVDRFDRAVGRPERGTAPREDAGGEAPYEERRPFWRPWWSRTGRGSPARDWVIEAGEESIPSPTERVEAAASRRRSWRRKGIRFGLVSVIVTLALAYMIPAWRADRSLRIAVSETDRIDPYWRLEDIEAARARRSEATNIAPRLLDVGNALPTRWHGAREKPSDAERKRLAALTGVMPAQCLASGSLQSLEAELNEAGPALARARALAREIPSEGRFPVAWASDAYSTRLPHLAQSRDVVNLLAYDVLLRCQSRDTDGALLACLAMLNVCRAIGDEPAAVSQRLRMELRAAACQQLELALAHGRASEDVLAALGRSLDAEEAEPLLIWGIRGERALVDRLLTSVESGAFTPKQVRKTSFFSTVLYLFRHSTTARAAHLRFCNSAEEIARRPEIEQLELFRQLDRSAGVLPPGLYAMVPWMLRLAATFHGSRARLRCAAVAVAAERYRLARGAWPTGLEALVPEFLAKVPADPFDGAPLRYRRLEDRIVIYSVGENGRDEGGEVESTVPPDPGRDVGFRLWDLSGRHRPAPDP